MRGWYFIVLSILLLLAIFVAANIRFPWQMTDEEYRSVSQEIKTLIENSETGDFWVDKDGYIHVVTTHPRGSESIHLRSTLSGDFGARKELRHLVSKHPPTLIKQADPRYTDFCLLFVQQTATSLPLSEDELSDKLRPRSGATDPEPAQDDPEISNPEPKKPSASWAFLFTLYFLIFCISSPRI